MNLFFFDLPRLSVDIDLNYIGQLDRQKMLLERPEVEKALETIFQREGLSIRRIPQKHAGGKWQLRYASVLGGNGNLEVDLNYMFRTPLFDAHQLLTQCSLDIEQLRLACLVYGAMGTKDWRQISTDEIHFEESELKRPAGSCTQKTCISQ